ncbi:MAG TPA: hypothetical protein IAA98_11520 [Candidatus Avipropionibacterium avicola]|uniref:Tetratricopeptide repeat protein n=1 Tax=Candidatus Avipropionibacterium avicola TaxID=2840701 RepID=A0A9D1GZV2_9ACTN|nr:hypothetical protein [Candidatus Avipropionibacterium avicola]
MPELTAEAIEVRDLVAQVAGNLERRRGVWAPTLERARQLAATITDPISGPDARMRIATIDHLLALRADQPGEALRLLDECLAGIEGLRALHRERGSEEAEFTRLNDHEWGVRLNRCQVLQVLGDWDGARDDVQRSLAMADASLQPHHHRSASLVSAVAIGLEREEFAEALALAQDNVRLCREHQPDAMGTALLTLAQVQARLGDNAAATTNADRAEPLIIDDPTAMANLHQLRALVAMAQRDLTGAEHHFADYAAHTADHHEVMDRHHRHEAATGRAFLLHSRGDLRGARKEYLAEVERARAGDDPVRLAGALCQLSGVTQDIALSKLSLTRITGRRRTMHEQALAEVDQASEHAEAAGRRHLTAGLDVQWAKYVAQYQQFVDPHDLRSVQRGLERCLPATVFLHHATFSVSTASGRRAMAHRHAAEAFTIAFALAFVLGAKEVVAELIELRCAAGQFRVDVEATRDEESPTSNDIVELGDLDDDAGGADTLGPADTAGAPAGVLLAPPPPLLFDPGRIVLTEAFGQASRRYGLPADDRSPVASW